MQQKIDYLKLNASHFFQNLLHFNATSFETRILLAIFSVLEYILYNLESLLKNWNWKRCIWFGTEPQSEVEIHVCVGLREPVKNEWIYLYFILKMKLKIVEIMDSEYDNKWSGQFWFIVPMIIVTILNVLLFNIATTANINLCNIWTILI